MGAETSSDGSPLSRCRSALLASLVVGCMAYFLVFSLVRMPVVMEPTMPRYLRNNAELDIEITLHHEETIYPGFHGNATTQSSSVCRNCSTLIDILMTMCGDKADRIEEAVTMMKSAIVTNALHSNTRLHFHIFSTENARPLMVERIERWPGHVKDVFSYRFIDTYFPEPFFQNMFRACSTQRLFMAGKVQDLEKAIYIDTDVLVLGSLLPLWKLFSQFTNRSLLGMADETFTNIEYYKAHPSFIHPKPWGVNAGILMMHLANIRGANWTAELKQIAMTQRLEKRNIVGDQDHLNEYMVRHPAALFKMPCIYNYRSDYCDRYVQDQCKLASTVGIAALHGNRMVFHKGRYTFMTAYNVFFNYNFTTDPISGVLTPLKAKLEENKQAKCFSTRANLYRNMAKTLQQSVR